MSRWVACKILKRMEKENRREGERPVGREREIPTLTGEGSGLNHRPHFAGPRGLRGFSGQRWPECRYYLC